MNKSLVMLVLASSMIPASSQAHFFAEAHDCRAPNKPEEFFSDLEKQQFEAQVADYRICLQTFIDKQNSALEKHQRAAQQAADTWQDYVQRERGAAQSETANPQ